MSVITVEWVSIKTAKVRPSASSVIQTHILILLLIHLNLTAFHVLRIDRLASQLVT